LYREKFKNLRLRVILHALSDDYKLTDYWSGICFAYKEICPLIDMFYLMYYN